MNKKKILISSYSMDIGGIERSLVSMLQNFNYEEYDVDLMLYKHEGELFNLIDSRVNILNEIEGYNTFGVSIKTLIKEKKYLVVILRTIAKCISSIKKRVFNVQDIGYYQVQLMRRLIEKIFPKLEKEYDVAISYYWPHFFVADKVKAKKKIAWIHTDYSTIFINKKLDLKAWNKFDNIISISDDCTNAFVKVYPQLKNNIILIENITSAEFIKHMASEEVKDKLDSKTFNILTVGRLCHQKAIDRAIEIYNVLENRHPNRVKWYVIGYGSEENNLRNMISKYKLENKFILMGKKVNPYPYMRECDLYVQPSRYEGKAVTITEAKILSKPIIITDYPTAKSQIENEIDGIIVNSDTESVADAIEKIINNKKATEILSNNCKKNDYTNSNELNKLYEIIERG